MRPSRPAAKRPSLLFVKQPLETQGTQVNRIMNSWNRKRPQNSRGPFAPSLLCKEEPKAQGRRWTVCVTGGESPDFRFRALSAKHL